MKTTLSQLELALPALEQEIQRVAGVKLYLHVEAMKDCFRITTDDLTESLMGSIAAPLFKSIHFEMSGSEVDGRIYFNPCMRYTLHGGGRNAISYIWDAIWYDTEKNAWIFRDEQLLYKKGEGHE